MEVCALPIDLANDQQQTALHIASLLGHAETVSELLRLGANTTLRTSKQKIAHDLAAQRGHDAVCALLEEGCK